MNKPNFLRPSFINPAIFFGVLAVLYALSLRAYFVGFFNDDAFFILGSKSLLHGSFSELNKPGQPPLMSYMPGYSLLLLPITLFADSTLPYQIFSIFLTLITVGIVFLLYKNIAPQPVCLAIVTLTAFHPLVISLSGVVLTDIPFLLSTLIFFLYFKEKWERINTSDVVVLVTLGCCSFYLRPIGGILIGLLVIFLLIERRWFFAILSLGLGTMETGVYFLRNFLIRGYLLSYAEVYLSPYRLNFPLQTYLAWIFENAKIYLRDMFVQSMFRWPWGTSSSLLTWSTILMSAGVTGVGFVRWKNDPLGRFIKFYIGLYVLVLLFWGVQSSRYLLPLLPFVFSYFFVGLDWISRRTFRSSKLVPVFSVVLLVIFLFPMRHILEVSLFEQTSTNTPPEKAVQWVQENSGPNDLFGVQLEGQFFLLTGRFCLQFPNYVKQADLESWVRSHRIGYIFVREDIPLLKFREDRERYQNHNIPLVQIPPDWPLVFLDGKEKSFIYKIPTPPNLPTKKRGEG